MSLYPPSLLRIYDGEDGTNLLPKMRWKKVIQNGDGQETVRSVQIRLPSAPAPPTIHEGGMEGDTPPVPDGQSSNSIGEQTGLDKKRVL